MTKRIFHFVHESGYPMGTDPSIWDVIFHRAFRLGERDHEQINGMVVGWLVPQIEAAPRLVSVPFHHAMIRLGLRPLPIRYEEDCMWHAEQMIPFLRDAARDTDALVVYSTGHIPVLDDAASQLDIPLINVAYVAEIIDRRGQNIEPSCIWRALLEVALHLLPDDNQ